MRRMRSRSTGCSTSARCSALTPSAQRQLERNGVHAQRLLNALPLGLVHLSKGEVAEERMYGDLQVGGHRLFYWPNGCGRRLTQRLDLG